MSDNQALVMLLEDVAELLRMRLQMLHASGGVVGNEDSKNIAAMARARTALQAAAAALAPPWREHIEHMALKVRYSYPDWAEAHNGIIMSDAELESIALFIRDTLIRFSANGSQLIPEA